MTKVYVEFGRMEGRMHIWARFDNEEPIFDTGKIVLTETEPRLTPDPLGSPRFIQWFQQD
jgi:hypothetical protein